MANFVSPGVYVLEKDLSDYTPAVNPTVVGVVGFATKGPVNLPTLITSQENLVRMFGRPTDDIPGQGIEGSLEILETANQLYYVRAAAGGTNAAPALAATADISIGACPAVGIGGTYDVTTDDAGTPEDTSDDTIVVTDFAWGTDQAIETLYLTIQVKDSAGFDVYATPKTYVIPPSMDIGGGIATTTAEAVDYIIGGGLDGDAISTLNGVIIGAAAGGGAELIMTASTDLAGTAPVAALMAAQSNGDLGGAVASLGVVAGDPKATGFAVPGTQLKYKVESIWPGTGYNETTLGDGTTIGNSISIVSLGDKNVNLNVNDNGIAEETFKVSLTSFGNSPTDLINTGTEAATSEFIKGNFYVNDTLGVLNYGSFGQTLDSLTGASHTINPRYLKFMGGTTGLGGGSNGDDSVDEVDVLVGESAPDRTGMQALLNENTPITLALVPGITDQNVQNNLINLAEGTGDFLAVVSPPVGIGSVQDAIRWSNGQGGGRTAALNNSYAALYYPWVKVFQPYLGKDVWMDPAVFGVRQMGYTDTVSELWFAPAGFVRGRLTKPVDTEVDLNQGDRDSMYSGGNVVNPIVNFPQQGITIFGQRTTQRAPTALDRINVRRLMVYIKRVITQSTTRFVFEPNDKITQERIQQLLVPLFEDIKRRRGITEFKVVCDETVNTPVRVDRNELWCKILIKPTKAAEVLVFELNITNQAANIG